MRLPYFAHDLRPWRVNRGVTGGDYERIWFSIPENTETFAQASAIKNLPCFFVKRLGCDVCHDHRRHRGGVTVKARLLCGGKPDPEGAAVAGGGVDAGLALHAFGGVLDNGQADAGAGVFLLGVQALEEAEDFFLVLGGDADAVVGDFKGGGSVLLVGSDRDAGGDALGNELDAVGNQVAEGLLEDNGVAADSDGAALVDDLAVAGPDFGLHLDEELADDGFDGDGFDFDGLVSELAELEKVIDEAGHARAAEAHAVEAIAGLVVELIAILGVQEARVTGDAAQGGLQVMGHAVGEGFQVADFFVEFCLAGAKLGGHGVEVFGEEAKFALRLDGRAVVEVAFADAAGGDAEGPEGSDQGFIQAPKDDAANGGHQGDGEQVGQKAGAAEAVALVDGVVAQLAGGAKKLAGLKHPLRDEHGLKLEALPRCGRVVLGPAGEFGDERVHPFFVGAKGRDHRLHARALWRRIQKAAEFNGNDGELLLGAGVFLEDGLGAEKVAVEDRAHDVVGPASQIIHSLEAQVHERDKREGRNDGGKDGAVSDAELALDEHASGRESPRRGGRL